MIKIAICDDNSYVIDAIKMSCFNYYSENKVDVVSFMSGEHLLQSNNHFDLIFLDVELQNMNGLEVAKEIRKTDLHVLIVMVSGHASYKNAAFPLHVFDFLDKPITAQAIRNVLVEVDKYYSTKNKQSYLTFKIKDRYVNFHIDDIYYFCYEGRKVKVHSAKGVYEFYENMSELAKRVKKFSFIMSHQSFIINLGHVIELAKGEVVLSNFERIPLSRQKSKEFIEDYMRFIGKEYQ